MMMGRTGIPVAWLVFALMLAPSAASAAPLLFTYTAHIDGSDRPGAPTGTILTGQFGYDPDELRRQVGSNYYPEFGTAPMTAFGVAGFALRMEARAIAVNAGDPSDTMTIQSFESESANDWHMVIDFIEPGGTDGWLMGDESLPESFPSPPDDAFMSIYFTDEFDWVRTIDATLLTVTPASGPLNPVPLPGAGWLLFSAMALLGYTKYRPGRG